MYNDKTVRTALNDMFEIFWLGKKLGKAPFSFAINLKEKKKEIMVKQKKYDKTKLVKKKENEYARCRRLQ